MKDRVRLSILAAPALMFPPGSWLARNSKRSNPIARDMRVMALVLLVATGQVCLTAETNVIAVPKAGAPPKDGWSEAVNGLRARLALGVRHTQAGESIPEVYLEFHNVSDRGLLMEFDYIARKSVHFELKSVDGKPAPKPTMMAGGNRCHETMRVQLPMDGALRFPISCHSIVTGTKSSRLIQLDPDDAIWEIPATDSQTYFLSGILQVLKSTPEVQNATWPNWRWDGTIKIPAVKIEDKR